MNFVRVEARNLANKFKDFNLTILEYYVLYLPIYALFYPFLPNLTYFLQPVRRENIL